MAFIQLIFTAQRLKKLQDSLIQEKNDAIKLDQNEQIKKKWKHYLVDLKIKWRKCWSSIICCGATCCPKTCYKLRTEGSCENYTLKSVFGFFGGVLLTYIFFIVFVFQLSMSLSTATVFCAVLGVILCVGMAFSRNVRCVVLLTLPQFFSKKGRQALLAYAFMLALTGPARNTLHNLGILSESLACGQEQLKQAVKQILDVIKKPFLAIKDAIKKVIKTVKEVVKKIKEILMKIKRVIMAIVRIIKAAFEFLGKIINICNKELGTPFERCTRAFENAITDCNAKLGPLFNWLCSITYIVKGVCYLVKMFDYVCMIVDFISDSVIGVVIRKVKSFVRHIKTFFYVRIKFSHSFQFQTNSSKSLRDVAKGIVGEIKDRTSGVRKCFAFMTSASTLFFVFIVFQTAWYRFKYLTNERFDNKYIYPEFRQIDLQRAKHNRETVLPLNKREQQLYAPINSPKLIKTESKELSKNAMVLLTASVKLATHCAADYCLFWVLTMITFYGRFQSKIQAPNVPKAYIKGKGLLADLLRAIVKAFQPMGIQLEIDTVPCLPVPIPPDYDRYVQILVVIIFCWILTILQPYGLRFRNYIMGVYHPVRQKERTIWLYNTLLRRRSSFLTFARRQLRRKFGDKSISQVSCKDWFRANLSCWFMRICCGDEHQEACMLCGEVFREGNKKIKCPTPGCPGIYCDECFADLQNICPLCRSPLEYGDLTDLDEEKDSSGDEPSPPPRKPCRICKCFPCCQEKTEDSDQEPLVSEDDHDEEIPLTSELPDSDYATDTSTDYSFSYQYEERSEEYLPAPAPSFVDVEKQEMLDYVDMRSFHEIMPAKDVLESDSSITDYEFEVDVDIDNADKATCTTMKLNVCTEMSGVCIPAAELVVGEFGKPIKRLPTLKVASGDLEPLLGDSSSSSETEEISKIEEDVSVCACSDTQRRVDFIGVPKDNVRKKRRIKRKVRKQIKDNIPFLKEASYYCSDLEHVLPEYDESLISIPKSTTSTSTSPKPNTHILKPTVVEGNVLKYTLPYCTTKIVESHVADLPYDIQEDIEYAQNVVPQLDLTSITNSYPNYDRNKLSSERFRNAVSYEEVCECPRSPRESPPLISLESSTLISGLNDLPSSNVPRRRFERNLRDLESPSSMDSIEFENQHRRLVKEYYKATNVVPRSYVKKPKIRNSVAKFFNKMFQKHKRSGNDLPQHLSDTDESVELQSYNYCRNNWETLSPRISTPTYPFGSQETETSTDETSRRPFLNRRIRGGESASFEATPPVNTRIFQRSPNIYRNSTGLRFEQDFSRLSLPAKPKPPTTQNLLSKYFVSIEDLTPTRDSGFPLLPATAIPTLHPICETSINETDLQQIPEKESKNLNESSASTEKEHNRSDLLGSIEPSEDSVSLLQPQHLVDPRIYTKKRECTTLKENTFPGTAKAYRQSNEKPIITDQVVFRTHQPNAKQEDRPVRDIQIPIDQPSTSYQPHDTGVVKKLSMYRPFKKDKTQLIREQYSLLESWNDLPEKLVKTTDKIQQTSNLDIHRSLSNFQNNTETSFLYNRGECVCPEKDVRIQSDINRESSRCRYCQTSTRMQNQTDSSLENRYGYLNYPEGPTTSTQPDGTCSSKCIPPKRTVVEYEEVWLPPPPPPPFYLIRRSAARWSPEPRISKNPCSCERCHPSVNAPPPRFSPRQCGDFEDSSSSCISNDESNQFYEEYMDLQYQNQEEYMELVQELEETLKSRNRNRVRRAMTEFEEKSRHNEPLEKPIIDYDETSESDEPLMEKINELRSGCLKKRNCCDGKKPCSCCIGNRNLDQERRCAPGTELTDEPFDYAGQSRCPSSRVPSHWIRDPTTGEWYKAQSSKKGEMVERVPCSCGLEGCYYCG